MTEHEPTAHQLSRSIYSARKARGWSQMEVASRAGVSRGFVSRVEAGCDRTVEALFRLSSSLGLGFDAAPILDTTAAQGTGPTTGAVGPQSRWNALSHRFAGEVASIEWQLNLVVALSLAADDEGLVRELERVRRLRIGDRTDLLRALDTADGSAQTAAAWLRELADFRNMLAHGWIVEATVDEAVFRSFYKGRMREVTVTTQGMASQFQKTRRLHRILIWLESIVGDPDVWSAAMGFADGRP